MEFTANDSNVKILGRSMVVDNRRYLDYSGSYIEFEFYGKTAKATLWSDAYNGDEIYKAFVAVYINDSEIPYKRFGLGKGLDSYELYSGNTEEKVKLRLVKLSEAAFGKLGIESIEIDGKEGPIPTKYLERKIEYIGDSITCGYGNEGIFEVDIFNTSQENPEAAYAVLTAKKLKADYHLISWSGIGIISNWVEATVDTPNDGWLMPMLYQYTDASLSDVLGHSQREIWDNKKFLPHVVVVNLGTNDASYTRKLPDRVGKFGNQYYAFLEDVRSKNPKAQIICTLGAMGQDLCPEIEKQVKQFASQKRDTKIHFMAFDIQLDADGIGSDWHPSKITHEKMANKLSAYIADIMKW